MKENNFKKINEILEQFEEWCSMKNLTSNKYNLVVFMIEKKIR